MKILKMLKKCFRDNESGFSLAELMVAAGIVGVISVALTRIMTQATKTQRKVTSDMTINEANIHIRNILRTESNCTKAFSGVDFAQDKRPNLNKVAQYNKDNIAVATYTIGQALGEGSGGKVTLKDIIIASDPAPKVLKAPSGTTPGRGEIAVNFVYSRIDETRGAAAQAQLKKMTYGGQEVRKQIVIQVDYDSSNKIVACNADLSNYQEQMCETAFQGQWDDVNDLCKSILVEPAPDSFRKISFGTQNAAVKEGLQVGGSSLTYSSDVTAGVGIGIAPSGEGNLDMNGTLKISTADGTNPPYIVTQDGKGITFSKANPFIKYSSNSLTFKGTTSADFSLDVIVGDQLQVKNNIYGDSDWFLWPKNIASTVTSTDPYIRLNTSGTKIKGTTTSAIALDIVQGRIRMDNVSLPTAAYPLASASYEYVPTMKWVQDFLLEGVANNMANSDSIVGQLIANMANYTVSQPMNAVSNMMCGKLKMVKTKYNSVGGAINSTVSGVTGANGLCTFNTPDINCTKSGECARVCIGSDCRTSWPAPDGVCSTSGQCARVCIGTTCKTRWPRLVFGNLNIGYCSWRGYAWNYGNPRVLCAGQEVVRGLQRNSAGTPTNALCCRHRNEMDSVWSN